MREKNKKLFVVVLGESDSGKSTTWYRLFDRKVITSSGLKEIKLTDYLNTRAYLFCGSPQERGFTIQEFQEEFKRNCIDREAKIVLCSLQTHVYDPNTITAREILEHANNEGYDIFIQWIYPGIGSRGRERRHLSTIGQEIIDFMSIDSVIGISNTNAFDTPSEERAEKLRSIILGWINSI